MVINVNAAVQYTGTPNPVIIWDCIVKYKALQNCSLLFCLLSSSFMFVVEEDVLHEDV